MTEPSVAQELEQLRTEAGDAIARAEAPADLEQLRVKYLGKKSRLTSVMRSIGTLPPEQRGAIGQHANTFRATIEGALATRR